ncbi:MAG: mechanosensitive ion channel [Maricaulis sp.]|jgi:small conductance mechanosensitive channel|nr:mechanosensitive ion channel [Maricaulis sp.]MDG2045338.1 mechanosensitive ion channel [Maricaulis sp.]
MNVDDYLDADAMTALMSSLIDVGTSVALAGLTLIAGLIFSGFVRKTIRRLAMANENVDDTLGNFFASLAYYAIMAMVLIAVLDRFDVETASLVAMLGVAGLAIGLALQGTLSNLAAGVMIILFRPYKLGEFVETGGQSGSVKDINLFTTELATGDNKKVIVPNGSIWGNIITNYSAHESRRIDFVFSIDYSDDISTAMGVIEDVLNSDKRVHKDPAVFTAVTAHGGSSVDIVTRVWGDSGDYWGIYFDAMKNVKEAFDAKGISIPYPHQVNINRKA